MLGIDFKRVQGTKALFEIVFMSDVTKGEYAFGNEKSKGIFCFTVYEGEDNKETQADDVKDKKRR